MLIALGFLEGQVNEGEHGPTLSSNSAVTDCHSDVGGRCVLRCWRLAHYDINSETATTWLFTSRV